MLTNRSAISRRGFVLTSTCLIAGAIAALAGPRQAGAESEDDIVIIVNKEVSVSSVSLDEVRQMFLGVRTSWPGGARVACVNAPDGTRLRDRFRARVLRMSADDEQRYWEEQKVQGKGQEPAVFASAVKAVFHLKGGIGYAQRSEVKGDVVKIVATLGR